MQLRIIRTSRLTDQELSNEEISSPTLRLTGASRLTDQELRSEEFLEPAPKA